MIVRTSRPVIQTRSTSGSGVASTSVESVAAAAGIGRPMKYFLSTMWV